MTFQLGVYTFPNPWILAPMAGVSEMPFRVIALNHGAAAAPTELVSCKGLIYGQARTARYLEHHPCEQPFWVQIFGGDAQSMADGAEKAVELGAKIIDVNMGCPVKKVTKNGAGSALLGDPQRAAGIIRAIVKRTGVPVTAKIRAGWDAHTLNFAEMGRALQDAGCAAVAMHARTRAQGYSGKANWELIRQLVQAVDIPVIGNGDVTSVELAHRMRAETGCAAVMIGRGALGNPWIFERLTRSTAEPPTSAQRWQVIRRHLLAHLDFVGEVRHGIRRFRPHLMWYAHGLTGAAHFRNYVNRVEEWDALQAACEAFFLRAEASAESGPVEYNERIALG